jgi:hypothetical protein
MKQHKKIVPPKLLFSQQRPGVSRKFWLLQLFEFVPKPQISAE